MLEQIEGATKSSGTIKFRRKGGLDDSDEDIDDLINVWVNQSLCIPAVEAATKRVLAAGGDEVLLDIRLNVTVV